jgi:cytochrome c556
MYYINRITLLILALLSLGLGTVSAQEEPAAKTDLQLSPELVQLLRDEMRALLGGVQSLPVGIATADWKSVADTSAQITRSYILEQKLTPPQKTELDTALPEHFKRLDAHFHLEAKKIEAAALNRDAQLAAFHYYRLIESCTACHALYAPSRFPGFSSVKKHAHEH